MGKKLYKLKYSLYYDENTGKLDTAHLIDTTDEYVELYAKKGQLAELEELPEDEWYYLDGILVKYHFNFIAKGGKFIYSETDNLDDWFEEVVR